ncbi:MAG: phage holin family protein, partial [Candidatus Cybelea sp.]
MHLLLRFIVNAIVLWLIVCLVPGFHNTAGATGFGAYSLWTVVLLAIIFGLVNALIGPILRLVSLPLTWITHGLFTVIIDWALLAL